MLVALRLMFRLVPQANDLCIELRFRISDNPY